MFNTQYNVYSCTWSRNLNPFGYVAQYFVCAFIDSHGLLEQKFRQTSRRFAWHFLTSCLMKTVSLFSLGDNEQMEKHKKRICLCVLYLSLFLWGFEEQRINHCDGVSLNVLIRSVARENKNANDYWIILLK